jgi:ATP phosphoribosyltransferase
MSRVTQQTAVESTIELLEDADYERRGVPKGGDAEAVFSREDIDVVLVEENGSVETYLFDENAGICSCGDHEDYVAEPGTAIKTAHARRQRAACPHANMLSNTTEKSSCEECGSHEFTRIEHKQHGRVVMVERKCGDCMRRW